MILLLIPALALAVVSLAAFFGEWVWWLDVLANFRAQYAIVLALLGGALVLTKWRKYAYGVLAIALVNAAVVLPLFVGSPGEADAAAPAARILNFNLLSTNEEFAEVIDYIEQINPDIVLLHEASRPWEVAVEAAELDYEIIRPRSDDLIFGTLVMVRGSGVEAVSFGFAANQPRAVEVVFTPDGWVESLAVLSTHPLAPTESERAAFRDAQLEFAGEWGSRQQGAYVIAGDFNATPWSSPFRKLLSLSETRNSQLGFGLQPTFPANSNFFLRVPIDHLVHSEGLVIRDRQLGPAMGSDHFPLVVDVQLG